MWGAWSKFIGLTNAEIKTGTQLYELLWNQSFDTSADQQAIKDGRNQDVK